MGVVIGDLSLLPLKFVTDHSQVRSSHWEIGRVMLRLLTSVLKYLTNTRVEVPSERQSLL